MTEIGIRLVLQIIKFVKIKRIFFGDGLHLQPMKNKISIISLSFTVMVMGAILLQSFHTFQHLEQFVTEKHCHHKYALNKTEIGHAHNSFDHCFVCEFALSNYTLNLFNSFDFRKTEVSSSYTLCYSKEITQSFRGALFALRAPPKIIA